MRAKIRVSSEFLERAMRRLLLSFPLNFASTDTIHSARLDLVCSNTGATNGLAVYPASTSVTWDENATWNSRDGMLMWGEPGADDGTDRSDWEPPIVTSPLGPSGGSSNVQLNVTALAQSAVASSASALEILVSALGSQYDCAMNETLNIPDRPSLRSRFLDGDSRIRGTIAPNFVDDGAPLMSDDFYLSADLTPSMTWDSYSGILAEVQLSMDDGFKSDEDNYNWLYNTDAHASSFTVSGTTGALDIPSSDAFDNGTFMHYRMRAMDSTGTLSSWSKARSSSCQRMTLRPTTTVQLPLQLMSTILLMTWISSRTRMSTRTTKTTTSVLSRRW